MQATPIENFTRENAPFWIEYFENGKWRPVTGWSMMDGNVVFQAPFGAQWRIVDQVTVH